MEVFLRHSDCLPGGKAVTRPQTAAAEKHSAVRKSAPVVVPRARNARVASAERSCRGRGTIEKCFLQTDKYLAKTGKCFATIGKRILQTDKCFATIGKRILQMDKCFATIDKRILQTGKCRSVLQKSYLPADTPPQFSAILP